MSDEHDDLAFRIESLERRLAAIEERNSFVTFQKRWETSALRRILIAALTLFFAGIAFSALGSPRPFMDALIPVTGFVVSTFSIPWIRERWIAQQRNAERSGSTR